MDRESSAFMSLRSPRSRPSSATFCLNLFWFCSVLRKESGNSSLAVEKRLCRALHASYSHSRRVNSLDLTVLEEVAFHLEVSAFLGASSAAYSLPHSRSSTCTCRRSPSRSSSSVTSPSGGSRSTASVSCRCFSLSIFSSCEGGRHSTRAAGGCRCRLCESRRLTSSDIEGSMRARREAAMGTNSGGSGCCVGDGGWSCDCDEDV
mmetsp:Transcript_23853/g.32687  ORF Transcript_23853/g.32687 Transcript_23853/m.32687 type:complete len:205 (-) Transcript_23853:1234-1848(-)